MGNKTLDSETDGPKENYKVIKYLAPELPQEFRNLVIAPFLNSLRYGNELFKLIDKDVYYHFYELFIERLLTKPMAFVRIAMLDDKTVLGWSLSDQKMLHYVWVKKEVRRQGIGKALLPKEFSEISHITNKGLSIWISKYPSVKFNPFV